MPKVRAFLDRGIFGAVLALQCRLLLVAVSPVPAAGAPITILPGSVSNLRDHRGVNDVGLIPGDRNQIGANIAPDAAHSTLTAVQAGAVIGPTPCGATSVNPDNCYTATAFSPTRVGSWLLTFQNGADRATVSTPSLAGADVPVPLAVNVSITGQGFTPTFRFVVPGGFIPDAIRINIFDKFATLPNNAKDIIHTAGVPSAARSYTVPDVLSSGQRLNVGHPYVFAVDLIKLRPGFTEADFIAAPNGAAMILNRSRSFFDFTLLTASGSDEVFLPSLGPDANPTDNRAAAYEFAITGITAGELVFIDPPLAIGYDYATGPGDPNFASVVLPNVGGGQFTVSFGSTTQSVPAGVQFFFPPGGVSAFSVRGINASAGLDPRNVIAFITGLTFVQDGQFTGTMTPITQAGGVIKLSLLVGVNQPAFSAGQTLITAVGLDNPGRPETVDLYLGLLLPDGTTIFFFTSPSTGTLGSLTNVASFQPIASGVSLATPFSATVPNFFSYTWTGGEPPGTYAFFLVALKSGALADGVVTSDEILEVATAAFSLQ